MSTFSSHPVALPGMQDQDMWNKFRMVDHDKENPASPAKAAAMAKSPSSVSLNARFSDDSRISTGGNTRSVGISLAR